MITVFYTCHRCGTKEESVSVPAREEHEDLLVWMEKVKAIIHEQHLTFHMLCKEEKVDLKIPMPANTQWVGQQTS